MGISSRLFHIFSIVLSFRTIRVTVMMTKKWTSARVPCLSFPGTCTGSNISYGMKTTKCWKR
jgi:hypothetical protein